MTLRVESEIRVGEAARAGAAAARRWGTGGWTIIVLAAAVGIGAAALGGLAASMIASALKLAEGPTALLRLVLGMAPLFAALPLVRRAINFNYRRRLASRGHAGPFSTSYEVTDQTFVYSIGGITKTVRWDAASELFRIQNWWVLMAQGESIYVPSRAFKGKAEERAFVAAVLVRLPTAAQDRSKEAATFVASPD